MTLIVGVLCSDGAVVGADGAATMGALGVNTIRQPIKKVTIIEDCVAVGVSGPVGLSQRITEEIQNLWSGRAFSNRSAVEAGVIVRGKIWPHLKMEIEAATVSRNLYGPIAGVSATAFTMLALPLKKKISLIQFDQQGAPEVVT